MNEERSFLTLEIAIMVFCLASLSLGILVLSQEPFDYQKIDKDQYDRYIRVTLLTPQANKKKDPNEKPLAVCQKTHPAEECAEVELMQDSTKLISADLDMRRFYLWVILCAPIAVLLLSYAHRFQRERRMIKRQTVSLSEMNRLTVALQTALRTLTAQATTSLASDPKRIKEISAADHVFQHALQAHWYAGPETKMSTWNSALAAAEKLSELVNAHLSKADEPKS